MADLQRLINRMSVLGPAEVVHRVSELARVKRMHIRFKQGLWEREYSGLNPADYNFCTATGHRLPDLPFSPPPHSQELDSLLKGTWPALGFDWEWQPRSESWRRAPDTGRIWPSSFFDSINYRSGNPYGDVRVAWEPSRLQQLISMALVAKENSASRQPTVKLMVDILVSWVQENPAAGGPHYISVMECALRIISVTQALDIVRPYLTGDSPAWPACACLVKSHADMIAERLSLYSSTGNHTIAECTGLVYAALLFPEMKEAGEWFRKGIRILTQEADHQILPDGGGVERSPWYHLLVVDLLGLTEALMTFHQKPVPQEIASAVCRGRSFLSKLGESPAALPRLNDADNGYALSSHLRLSWTKPATTETVVTFPDTGLTRVSLGGSSWLTLDHGSLGHEPLYAHGHADALALTIQVEGKPLAIDPGTYMYTGGSEWRSYFRSTRAHNTVEVDGQDQASQAAPFQWAKPYQADLIRTQVNDAGTVFLLARHDGYAARQVTHYRLVICVPESMIIIRDVLQGDGVHISNLHWHFGGTLAEEPGGLRIADFNTSIFVALQGGHRTEHRGETSPVCGWASTQYGQKHPVTTIRLSHQGTLPHEFLTTIHFGDSTSSAAPYIDAAKSWIEQCCR